MGLRGLSIIWAGLILISCSHAPLKESIFTVSMGQVIAQQGKKVGVPVIVSGIPEGIAGIDLELEFDPNYLRFVSAEVGSLTKKWQIMAKEVEAKGKIKVALFDVSPIRSKQGSIVLFNLEVKKNAKGGMRLPLRLTKAIFNEKPAAKINDGLVVLK